MWSVTLCCAVITLVSGELTNFLGLLILLAVQSLSWELFIPAAKKEFLDEWSNSPLGPIRLTLSWRYRLAAATHLAHGVNAASLAFEISTHEHLAQQACAEHHQAAQQQKRSQDH
jgi:hypothetical protein